MTWNVRGMRDKIKRTAILIFIKIHIRTSPGGVTVLVAKSTLFELIALETDPQGRYIFIFSNFFIESKT